MQARCDGVILKMGNAIFTRFLHGRSAALCDCLRAVFFTPIARYAELVRDPLKFLNGSGAYHRSTLLLDQEALGPLAQPCRRPAAS